MPCPDKAVSTDGQERRVPGLDGLRGTATIMVVVSHYFGEIPHGLRATMFGWIGVDIFFVLSGYLIGKLILDRCHHVNFFEVFYVRRFCRIVPAYLVTLIVIFGLLHFIQQPWTSDGQADLPTWSYFAFAQSYFMVTTGSVGTSWLSPTWTLALEEHFYLLIPAAIVFLPRRWLVPVLASTAVLALCLRIAVYLFGFANHMVALALLPGRADILVCGLLAAIAVKSHLQYLRSRTIVLRVIPLAALVLVFFVRLASNALFEIVGPFLIAIACAAFLLGIVLGTPEAKRYDARFLRFIGDNSYCIYLTHLPVLGLLHGLILHTQPDLATSSQWLITLAALPACVLVGRGMTMLIEEPWMRFGRKWRWRNLTDLEASVAVAA